MVIKNIADNIGGVTVVVLTVNTKPLVTIGVPFYNPGAFLLDCIRSILAQTFNDWELLLVDDGSNDGSVEVARAIDDPRVRVMVDGERKGLAYRLNQIVELSRGKFVARMDADDIMHPERIKKQLEILIQNESVDAVTTGACYIDLEGNVCGIKKGGKPNLDEVFLRGGYLHASLVARKSFLQKIRYDETLRRAEDRDFFVRCSLNGAKIVVLPEPLYYYRWVNNVRWRSWLLSYAEERRVIIRYGAKYSKIKMVIWYCRSWLKTIALLFLVAVRKEQILTRKALGLENAADLFALQDCLRLVKLQNIKYKHPI